jgi:hypothetical protein
MAERSLSRPLDRLLPPSPWQFREQIDRLAAHATFSRSPASLKLLRFLGDSVVTTGGKPVSQRIVADALLGLADGFRPTENPLVRMQVVRLRRKLLEYYAGDGANDPVVVSLPRGRYSLEASWNGPTRNPTGLAEVLEGRQPDFEARASMEGQLESVAGSAGALPAGNAPASRAACNHPWPVVLVAELFDAGLGESFQSLPLITATLLVPKLLGSGQFWAIGPLSRRRAHLEGVDLEEACDRYRADYVLEGQLALEANALSITLRLLHWSSADAVWVTWCSEDLTALPVRHGAGEPDGEPSAFPLEEGRSVARADVVGEIIAGRIAVMVRDVFRPQGL